MNVLFVCSGNTCRSAMAAGIAKDLIGKDPQRYRHIKVASAGTFAQQGEQASPLAQEVCAEHGVSLADFVAQQVTPALLREADVVLAMTGSHKKLLNTLAPEAMDKIFLLKEYADGENVNALNVRFNQLAEEYTMARENFVKGNQERLLELERLHEVDPASAQELFMALNSELGQQVKALDGALNAIHDKLAAMEIADPFGGDKAEYESCYTELVKSIAAVLEKLVDTGVTKQED